MVGEPIDLTISFINQDAESFLPPAVERWHQLVKPTLQLVASILSAAGSTNGEAVKQGTDFVIGHRETLRSLLLESGRFSLSHLAELSLIVTICSYVAAKVDHNELVRKIILTVSLTQLSLFAGVSL